MNILVTGATGQLGKCLQDIAIQYSNYDFHFKSSADLDITSIQRVAAIFAKEKFDFCINCAAYTAVDKAESNKENAYLINAEAVKNIAEQCTTYKTVLIHISTDFVFDGTKGVPYTEEDLPNPINVYGASKLQGEKYVQSILNNYFIIRTSWLYSEYGHNFVKTMLRLGKERNQLSVVNDQFGSPTYAGDLAECIVQFISGKFTDYGIYHYSNEGNTSWHEFAKKIFEFALMDVEILPIASSSYMTPALRPKISVLSKEKIKKLVGFPIPAWEESLKKVLMKAKECKNNFYLEFLNKQ